VAACEFDIKRFDRETNAGPAFFPNEPETYKLSDGSGGGAQGASGSEWCQRSPTRDGLDGGAHVNGGSEWLRRPRTRSQDRQGRDNGVSVVVSSAGSGGSRSLDVHKRDLDVVLARLKLQGDQRQLAEQSYSLPNLMPKRDSPGGRVIRRRLRRYILEDNPLHLVLTDRNNDFRLTETEPFV
jgi:hypothetical protein